MDFLKADNADMSFIYSGMLQNFVRDELREYEDFARVFHNGRYGVYHITENGKRLGFVGIWELEGFAFVEHFVIYADFRCSGYGSAAMRSLQAKYGNIVLEMEAPQSDDQIRRYAFYSRLGFYMNEEEYFQPAYHEDCSPYPLKLMSFPKKLDAVDYVSVKKAIYSSVYAGDIARVRKGLKIRKLRSGDDLKQVARLIYYTDGYIFPYLFGGKISAAEEVLSQMIQRDTIYNKKSITVACSGGDIAAILIMHKAPVTINAEQMIASFIAANQIVDERFTKVYNEYYKLLQNEPQGVYIANVCVDKCYRGYGLAYHILQKTLKDDVAYNLETVKANLPALNTYLKAGFVIDYEYPGFTGVPCYRMHRPTKGK